MSKLSVIEIVQPLNAVLESMPPGTFSYLQAPISRILRITRDERQLVEQDGLHTTLHGTQAVIVFLVVLDESLVERHQKSLKKWEALSEEERQKGKAPEPPCSPALMCMKIGADPIEGRVLRGDAWVVGNYVFFTQDLSGPISSLLGF
jgi:hypothetical protein